MEVASYSLIGPTWSRAFRCIWMMEELGLQYELSLNMPHSKDVVKHNPIGKVPVLLEYTDNNSPPFVLTESAAINTYLGDKYPSSCLVPRPGTKERAIYDQTILFVLSEIDAQALWTFRKYCQMGSFFTAIPEIEEPSKKHFEKINGFVSDQLQASGGKYLLGGNFTAADILYAHCLDWAAAIGWHEGFSTCQVNYLDMLHQRPAYLKAKERSKREKGETGQGKL